MLSEAEKTRVREGCYDLLLILSQEADPAEGLRLLDRAVRLRPETTAAYHLRRADCLGRAGDLAGRDREIRAAEQTGPVTALDYFLNGRELAIRGRFTEAIRPLEMAVQRDPDQTSAHLLLAVCYHNLRPKLLSEARTSLSTCIRSHPDLVGLYLMRALIFGEEGSQAKGKEAADAFEAAEEDYRLALKLKVSDDVRYGLLANRGLLRIGVGRLDEAVADLECGHPAQAGSLPGPHDAGPGASASGPARRRLHGVRPCDRLSSGTDAHWPDSIARRALIHAKRRDITPGQNDSALRDLAEAIRLEPDKALQASDQVWRARLFFARGQSEEALADCDAALKLVPDDSEAHRVRISSLMKLKRYDAVLASADAYIASGNPRPRSSSSAAWPARRGGITPRRSPTSIGPSSSSRTRRRPSGAGY